MSTRDIQSPAGTQLAWDASKPLESLERLFDYAILQANRSEDWYWQRKRIKARGSQVIQWTVIVLTSLAATVPILARLEIFPGFVTWLRAHDLIRQVDSGLLTSLFIGVAAALLGFDRVSGLSSGWTRYVLTGTVIRSTCEEFRMDWTALLSQLGSAPPPEKVLAMIERAKTFRMDIEAIVLKETQDWATEFQNNLAQAEKDLRGAIDQVKAERIKAERARQEQAAREGAERDRAGQPGSIEAIVENAADTDEFRFQAKLETAEEVIVSEAVSRSRTWALLAVPAGQYKLTVSALVKEEPVAGMTVVWVRPGETTKTQLRLPELR